MKKLPIFIFTLILAGCSFGQQLLNVSIDSSKNEDRVIMEFSGEVVPKLFTLKDPERVVMDFEDVIWDGGKKEILSESPRLSKIRWAQNSYKPDIARVVIDVKEGIGTEIVKESEGKKIILLVRNSAAPAETVISQKDTATAESGIKKIDFPVEEKIQEAQISSIGTVIEPPRRIILPDLSMFRRFSVIVNGQKIDTGMVQVFDKKVLLVPLKDLIAPLGFSIKIEDEGKTFKARTADGIEAVFYLNSNRMDVNGTERLMARPAKKIKGKIYVPFISVVKWLGYSAMWQKDTKKLFVLPRITGISYQDYEGSRSVVLESSATFATYEAEKKQKPLVLIINAPGFILDVKEQKIPVNEDGIKGIKAVQMQDGSAKIGIYLSENQSYNVSAKDNKLIISFLPTINTIKVTEEAESVKILIFSTKPVNPNIRRFSNPDRIIADIPGSCFEGQKQIEIGKGGVLRTRASQFMINPPASRVVIDLQKELEYAASVSDDNKTISISIEKEEVTAKKAKKVKVLKNKIIVLDPGHGGGDPGGFGYSGESVKEKDIDLSTAHILAKMLSDAGAIVLLTREDDVEMTLQNRVDFANNNKADILLCMHYNSFYKAGTSGTETYYFNPNSKLLASTVHRSMLADLERANRSFSKVKFFVIANAEMPSVLVEPVYLSNPEEEKLALDPVFQEKVAKSIFEAVKEYFRIIGRVN
jgi:N-acetylmuramoyl-L-alanine amidase